MFHELFSTLNFVLTVLSSQAFVELTQLPTVVLYIVRSVPHLQFRLRLYPKQQFTGQKLRWNSLVAVGYSSDW